MTISNLQLIEPSLSRTTVSLIVWRGLMKVWLLKIKQKLTYKTALISGVTQACCLRESASPSSSGAQRTWSPVTMSYQETSWSSSVCVRIPQSGRGRIVIIMTGGMGALCACRIFEAFVLRTFCKTLLSYTFWLFIFTYKLAYAKDLRLLSHLKKICQRIHFHTSFFSVYQLEILLPTLLNKFDF